MRRIAIASIIVVLGLAPAQAFAHGTHQHDDRPGDRSARNEANGLHRYYGSDYAETETGWDTEQRRDDRERRHHDRDRKRPATDGRNPPPATSFDKRLPDA